VEIVLVEVQVIQLIIMIQMKMEYVTLVQQTVIQIIVRIHQIQIRITMMTILKEMPVTLMMMEMAVWMKLMINRWNGMMMKI
jgi:hypothetical protein